jgi:hypothetical protein
MSLTVFATLRRHSRHEALAAQLDHQALVASQ